MSKNKKATTSTRRTVSPTRRKMIVFATLIGSLTLTSVLLLAVSPQPLSPNAFRSLFAVENPASLDVIFDTRIPQTPGRWKYIYIHHTKTLSGSAATLSQGSHGMADHFLICNGDGGVDGEIQISHRWNSQQSAQPPYGAESIDPACISIALVGDFDYSVPTPLQTLRLRQLVWTLQNHYQISGDRVIVLDKASSPVGTGKHFPMQQLRDTIIP